MTVEISNENGRRLREQLENGPFTSVDEVIASALSELASRQSKLERQRLALQQSAGAWKDEDHPELALGSAAWVHEIREESKRRIEQLEQGRNKS